MFLTSALLLPVSLLLPGLFTSCIPGFFIFWWPENFVQSSLSEQILLLIVFWTCKHQKEVSNNLHFHFPTFRRLTRKIKQTSTVVLQTYKSVCHLMRTPISFYVPKSSSKKGVYMHMNAEDWMEDRQLHIGTLNKQHVGEVWLINF